jgi:hypothetical protein
LLRWFHSISFAGALCAPSRRFSTISALSPPLPPLPPITHGR